MTMRSVRKRYHFKPWASLIRPNYYWQVISYAMWGTTWGNACQRDKLYIHFIMLEKKGADCLSTIFP